MIEMNAEVQSHVENGLFFAMILVWQFAVLERDPLAFRKKSHLNRVFARRVHNRRSTTLDLILCHRYS
jgi:hypothetical protein